MNRPTWDNFIAVNAGDKQNAFEALARMLFKAKYNMKDNLAYFKNHAGNETDTITVNGSIVGFQAKYFEGSINKTEIIKSMTKAKANNPGQTDYVIYTNSAFGNPKGGKTITDSQKAIEDDFAFNLFEKELNDRGLLYNVKSEDSIEDIQQKGFVKVTGRILFSDYGRIKDTIVNFNDLGRAFGELSLNSTMGQFNEISEQIRNIRDRNAKAKSKQAAKQVQSQIDVLLKNIGLMQDERLIQNLSTIMNYGYRDDLDVRIAIEGSDLCCTAIINPDYLKEPVRILLSKYSRITEIDFTVIGIITQSGVEKITFPQPEGETIKTTTQNLTEQIGVIESQFNGRMRNEYIIDPIAIYSEL